MCLVRRLVRERDFQIALSLFATMLIATVSLAASYQFTSADGGYSIAFPASPQEQVSDDANFRSVLNALNHDNGYYAVAHTDHNFDLRLDEEFDGNIAKFTKQIGAPTQLRRKKKFQKGPGEQLPAEEFTFESDELVGKGIVIVEARRTYMVAAFGIKPHNRKTSVDRFIASFKFKGPDKNKKPDKDSEKVAKGKTKQ